MMDTELNVDYIIMAINAYCNTETKHIADKYKFPMPILRSKFEHRTPIVDISKSGLYCDKYGHQLVWKYDVQRSEFNASALSYFPGSHASTYEDRRIFISPWDTHLRNFLVECEMKGIDVLFQHREELDRLNKDCFAWFMSKTWYHRPPSRNKCFHGWYKGFPYDEPVEVRYDKSGIRYSLPCNWFAEIEKP